MAEKAGSRWVIILKHRKVALPGVTQMLRVSTEAWGPEIRLSSQSPDSELISTYSLSSHFYFLIFTF